MPHTLFALDNTRPDLLIFRAMAPSLILWVDEGDEEEVQAEGGERGGQDGVRPTVSWLRRQLPPLLLQNLFSAPLRVAEGKAQAAQASAVKEEDVGDSNKDDCSLNHSTVKTSTNGNINGNIKAPCPSALTSGGGGMSLRASFQALVCILAGSAWGLALRHAGTSNRLGLCIRAHC